MAFGQVNVKPSEIFQIYRQPGVDLASGINEASDNLKEGIIRYQKKQDDLAKEADAVNQLHQFNENDLGSVFQHITDGKNAELTLNLYQAGLAGNEAKRRQKLADLQIEKFANDEQIINDHGKELLKFDAGLGGPLTLSPEKTEVRIKRDATGQIMLDDKGSPLTETVKTPAKTLDLAAEVERYFTENPGTKMNSKTFKELHDSIDKIRANAAATTNAGIRADTVLTGDERNIGQMLRAGDRLAIEAAKHKDRLVEIDTTNAAKKDRLALTLKNTSDLSADKIKARAALQEDQQAFMADLIKAQTNLANAKTDVEKQHGAEEIAKVKQSNYKKWFQLTQAAQITTEDRFGEKIPGLPAGSAYWKVFGVFEPDVIANYAADNGDTYGFYSYLTKKFFAGGPESGGLNVVTAGAINLGDSDAMRSAIHVIDQVRSGGSDPLSKSLSTVSIEGFKKFLADADAFEDARIK